MRPRVLPHFQPVHGGRNNATIGNAIPLLMGDVHRDIHFRQPWKHRHPRENLLT
ncbi:MAG: hypothetical protein V9G20_03470 [Candidatus Promineifilaceae bacterium]